MSRFRANRTKSFPVFPFCFPLAESRSKCPPSLVEATRMQAGRNEDESPPNVSSRDSNGAPREKLGSPVLPARGSPRKRTRRRSLRFSRRSKADERMQAREKRPTRPWNESAKTGNLWARLFRAMPAILVPSDHRCGSTYKFRDLASSVSLFLPIYLPIYLSLPLLLVLVLFLPVFFFACSLCPLGSQFALSLLSLSLFPLLVLLCLRTP